MKTILVLEDELSLMTLLHRVLGRAGYRILEAVDADEAVRQFKDNDRHIDLLIADVTLPKVSGLQVALLLRAELPGLSVILTSGYPTNAWSVRDCLYLGRLGSKSVAILQKPFAPQSLLSTIGELVGAPPSQTVAARTA